MLIWVFKKMMDKNLKLFGMEIFLRAEQDGSGESSSTETNGGEQQRRIDEEEHEEMDDDMLDLDKDKSHNGNSSCELDGDPKAPVQNSVNNQKIEHGEKIPKTKLKKPEKILPCPRCNSYDTKFCYYNNYNINQPRHFCRSCQRYWTAGGTMRNVPVGAGRRKSKSSSFSQCHNITISEALLAAKIDACKGFQCLKLEQNGTLLCFGSASIGGSVGLTGKQVFKNGGDLERSSTPEARNDFQAPLVPNVNPFPVPGQRMPWNFPMIPVPVIYHPPYNSHPENSAISWPATPYPAENPAIIDGVGKHSRNRELKTSSPTNTNNGSPVLVPKTLRIDDPTVAAKSTIWTTLGISHDSLNRKRLFQVFQPKTDQEKPMPAISPAMVANPSALLRSTFFNESA